MKKKESNDTGVGLLLGLSLGHGVKHFGQSALSVIGPFLKVYLQEFFLICIEKKLLGF